MLDFFETFIESCLCVFTVGLNFIQGYSRLVFGEVPLRASRVLSFFQVCVFFESLISFHVLHGFLVLLCIFFCFYCVSWRASCDSWVVGMPVFFGGVGGLGGCWGGLITFLFINVPASAFLTRFSLLQVTVWHAFDVLVLICWRWCPVACGHGVWFGGGLERSKQCMRDEVKKVTSETLLEDAFWQPSRNAGF